MKKILIVFATVFTFLAACEKKDDAPVYLEVNANNISGTWMLVRWNGSALAEGTYVYLDIVRNGRTYTMYQNVDSFADVPHVVTGSYYLYTEPDKGTLIRGDYDYDTGEWKHRYIIRDLTQDSMVWIAEDDPEYVQSFSRISDLPFTNK